MCVLLPDYFALKTDNCDSIRMKLNPKIRTLHLLDNKNKYQTKGHGVARRSRFIPGN